MRIVFPSLSFSRIIRPFLISHHHSSFTFFLTQLHIITTTTSLSLSLSPQHILYSFDSHGVFGSTKEAGQEATALES